MHTGLNTCTETTTATAASSLQSFAAAWVSAHELQLQLHRYRRARSILLPYSQSFNSSSWLIIFFRGRSKLSLRPPTLLSVSGIVWSCCSSFGDKHMIINKMLTHLCFSKLGYFWQTEAWLSLSIYQDCVITLLTSLNKWPKPVGFKS